MSDIEYRWLEGPEACEWLNDFLRHKGWTELNENTCRALCAFDGPNIVGFSVVQLFPHAEPLYVMPEYRGTGLADTLAEKMTDYLRDVRTRAFIAIADSPFAEKLCQKRGMKKIESPVYMATGE